MTVKEICEISNPGPRARELATDEATPASYLDSLEKQELYQDAVDFLAHKLPTLAGVKWANRCLREMRTPESPERKDEVLEASERWVQAQGDTTRWAAKDAADKASGPSVLVGMAVYLSGGSLSPPGSPEVHAPPYTAQKMIAGSVMAAVVSEDPQHLSDRYKRALAFGKELDV